MNKIILTIFCVFFISSISAMYSGECDSIEFPNSDNVNFEVIGNSSNMEGFNWDKNLTNITYCFDSGFYPDNFTLKWYNNQEVYVSDSRSSSRGGGGPKIISKEQIENGFKTKITKGKYIPFKLNLNHRIYYRGEDNGRYEFLIQSEPVTIFLSVGESINIALDLDSKEVINIKLISANKGSVQIEIKEYVETPANPIVKDKEEYVEEKVLEVDSDLDDDSNPWKIVIVIIFVLIIILLLYIIKREGKINE